jgi:hypothetical protein
MRYSGWLLLLLSGLPLLAAVPVVLGSHPAPRETLGAERLRSALANVPQPGARAIAGTRASDALPGFSARKPDEHAVFVERPSVHFAAEV